MHSLTGHHDYLTAAKRPLAGLLFVLPLLAIYEIGVLCLGDGVAPVRTGTDIWMRGWLTETGWRFPVLLPILTIGTLLGWHRARGDAWSCRGETLVSMLAESCFLAVLLAALGHLLQNVVLATGPTSQAMLARSISFIGAGVYEEVLFRLILLPLVFFALRSVRLGTSAAWVGSILLVSLTFATCHYLVPETGGPTTNLTTAAIQLAGNSELWFGFLFRTLAGIYFSSLFLLRGFGVAVGAHVLYDLLAGVLLAGAG
jgi:hypothetical protein